MYVPFGPAAGYDPTKVGPASMSPPPLTGEAIYQLLHQPLWVENFANLAAWTETDADGKVNLAAGVVSMDGGDAWTHGISKTVGIARAEGFLEFKAIGNGAVYDEWAAGIRSACGLIPNDSQSFTMVGWHATGKMDFYCPWAGTDVYFNHVFANATWYTIRMYILKNTAGLYEKLAWTIQGGTLTEETLVGIGECTGTAAPATFYPSFTRFADAPTKKAQFKEVRWCSGYDITGQPLEYLADAGVARVFSGLNFTNFVMPGGLSTANLMFAYSFDDGAAAYSGWKTLAQLQAVGAVGGRHRHIRLKVQMNSDGVTQVYGINPNAADGVADVLSAPAVPTWGMGEVSGIH